MAAMECIGVHRSVFECIGLEISKRTCGAEKNDLRSLQTKRKAALLNAAFPKITMRSRGARHEKKHTSK